MYLTLEPFHFTFELTKYKKIAQDKNNVKLACRGEKFPLQLGGALPYRNKPACS